MNKELQDFIDKCNIVFKDCITFYNETVNLQINAEHPITISSPYQEIATSIDNLKKLSDTHETALYNDNHYETLIASAHRFYPFMTHQDINIHDSNKNICYTISKPTNAYIIHFINKIYDATVNTDTMISTMSFFFNQSHRHVNFFDGVIEYIPFFKTLKISSPNKLKLHNFTTLSNSFRFNLSFKKNAVLIEEKSYDRFIFKTNNTSFTNQETYEIDPPRREYNEDLIHQYHLAKSAESSQLQFLSYYHIIEYFFESIYTSDLIENIREKITSPSFSYNDNKDIKNLISLIKNKLPNRQDAININELEALKLCIRKYVDLTTLCNTLSNANKSLIEYYTTTKVNFCGGSTINFNKNDEQSTISHIAKRIYSTRNSIVHNKDNGQGTFTPFIDETILAKEIPLIQNISEQIIFKTSSPLSL
ncbi:MAG: hypothetical protein B193_2748 [Solidesulfovibrio magneticus str. Maddingley MBC34]|uniref:Uncharacterized protein n=1 Tax=Solidesulfovibrio magneticus str. Maddingley MBC34 TaxID=1206767 RepID=K6GNL5_9BACT|nr:MAG: hypothetical protein B193_2748 [Solidesulfovibrio magneticus str. Maddingley MBC34]